MIDNYFKKNREKLFPNISDWSIEDPLNTMKKKQRDITNSEYFFFHPTPFKIVFLGTPIMFMINSVLGFLMGMYLDSTFTKTVMVLLFGISLYHLAIIQQKHDFSQILYDGLNKNGNLETTNIINKHRITRSGYYGIDNGKMDSNNINNDNYIYVFNKKSKQSKWIKH